MFKQYLRIFPKGLQLSVLLSLWAAMMLILTFAMPIIIKAFTGFNDEQLQDFYKGNVEQYANLKLILNVVGVIFSLAIPAFIFSYLAHPKPLQYLGLTKVQNKKQIILVIVLALALMFVIGTVGTWIQQIHLGQFADDLQKDRKAYIDAYFKDFSAFGLFRNLLFIALVPAVAEEIFFRGIVQKFAYSYTNRPGLAIIISAFFFAIIHFSVYEIIPIFWAGIVLGWVYYITSSLWLSILLHFVHNALQVCWVFLSQKYSAFTQVDESSMVSIVVFIVSAIIFYFTIKLLNKNKTPLPYDWSVVETIENKENNNEEP